MGTQREPQPTLAAIYFIGPEDGSIRALIEDFGAKKKAALYKAAYVFFSSTPSARQLEAIKSSPKLVAKLRALKEVRGGV